jgi:hypothetical protein
LLEAQNSDDIAKHYFVSLRKKNCCDATLSAFHSFPMANFSPKRARREQSAPAEINGVEAEGVWPG